MKRTSIILMVVLLTMLVGAGLAAAQTKELVVMAWGDPYEAGFRKSLVPTFEKKYGVKIVWVPSRAAQTAANLLAQRGNPQVDVAMTDDGPHMQLVSLGVVDRIDRSKLTNAPYLYDLAFEPGDYGIGFSLDGTGLYYNTKVFAENKWAPPTSWLDLFRPEFKGKVSAHHITNANGLNLLLALNRIEGGSESNVEPGFAKVRELARQVVTFDKAGETPALIQQGLAVIGVWAVGRTANLAAAGVPIQFVYPKEGAVGIKEMITIVKGRPNQDLAHKFIDMVLSREEQENTAKFVGLGPVNKQAKLDPEVAKQVIYSNEFIEKMVILNWPVVNANRAAWTERWNKEVESR